MTIHILSTLHIYFIAVSFVIFIIMHFPLQSNSITFPPEGLRHFNIVHKWFTRAQSLRRNIVLCEVKDPRVLTAGLLAQKHGIANITFLATTDIVARNARRFGWKGDLPDSIRCIAPEKSDDLSTLAGLLYERRRERGVTIDAAYQLAQQPLIFAHLLVASGKSDGCVSGAIYTTSEVIRIALQMIGKQEHVQLVSSSSILLAPGSRLGSDGFIFTDCGLVIEPDANELAHIALAGAISAHQFLGQDARVAMLSFSTMGSARHALVDKVRSATDRVRLLRPDLKVMGEVQADAALIPSIAMRKLSKRAFLDAANVLVFPNLDAGNIGHKLAERLGGMLAIGPILHGLTRPANDLSRSCSVEDILCMIAITALQSSPLQISREDVQKPHGFTRSR